MAQELIAIALKTSLLMCAGGIASAALLRGSAAARHLVWVSALALTLLLPFAAAIVPSYAVMEVPGAASVIAAPATQPVTAASGWSDLLWSGVVAAWGIGALLFLLRDALSRAGLARFSRRVRAVSSPHWALSLQAVERRGAMRVLETDHVAGPCTWGFFKPTLVLPISAEHWSEAERRYALIHELAHIERRDYVSAQLVRLACAVHWYNPLVWHAARQVHKLQEQACDDAVLRAGAVPSDYAQLLVDIARNRCGSPRMAMSMAERSPLYHRVRAILDPRRTRAARSRAGALATIVPLTCVMALIAGAGFAQPRIARAAEPAVAAEAVAAAAPAREPAEPARIPHARRAPATRPATPADDASPAEGATPALAAPGPLQPLQPVPPLPVVAPVAPLPVVPPLPPLPPQPE